jgi:hypothetical protein
MSRRKQDFDAEERRDERESLSSIVVLLFFAKAGLSSKISEYCELKPRAGGGWRFLAVSIGGSL